MDFITDAEAGFLLLPSLLAKDSQTSTPSQPWGTPGSGDTLGGLPPTPSTSECGPQQRKMRECHCVRTGELVYLSERSLRNVTSLLCPPTPRPRLASLPSWWAVNRRFLLSPKADRQQEKRSAPGSSHGRQETLAGMLSGKEVEPG